MSQYKYIIATEKGGKHIRILTVTNSLETWLEDINTDVALESKYRFVNGLINKKKGLYIAGDYTYLYKRVISATHKMCIRTDKIIVIGLKGEQYLVVHLSDCETLESKPCVVEISREELVMHIRDYRVLNIFTVNDIEHNIINYPVFSR